MKNQAKRLPRNSGSGRSHTAQIQQRRDIGHRFQRQYRFRLVQYSGIWRCCRSGCNLQTDQEPDFVGSRYRHRIPAMENTPGRNRSEQRVLVQRLREFRRRQLRSGAGKHGRRSGRDDQALRQRHIESEYLAGTDHAYRCGVCDTTKQDLIRIALIDLLRYAQNLDGSHAVGKLPPCVVVPCHNRRIAFHARPFRRADPALLPERVQLLHRQRLRSQYVRQAGNSGKFGPIQRKLRRELHIRI